jgi:hypothetical protein
LLGLDHPLLLEALRRQSPDSFARGKQLGQLEFMNEGSVEMDSAFGSELDGRLFTSLSDLGEKKLVTPADLLLLSGRSQLTAWWPRLVKSWWLRCTLPPSRLACT